MRNVLLLILSLCISGMAVVNAQDTTKPASQLPAFARDTTVRPGTKSSGTKTGDRRSTTLLRMKTERRKFDSTLFTTANIEATTSDYLENMEKVFQMLSSVPATTGSFVHLQEIEEKFDDEDSALAILKDRIMVSDERNLNIRNLQMFNTLLDELDKSTGRYSKYLDEYDKKMDEIKKQIASLRKDTLMLHIFRDSALKASFDDQLQQLKVKWREADSLVKQYGAEINDLQARASADAISINDLIYHVDTELKDVGSKAFGKERRYLWEPRSSGARRNFSREDFQKSVDSEKKLTKYYFSNSRSKRFWLFFTGLVFFVWVSQNFRTLKRLDRLKAIEGFQFRYINALPFAASLAFILTLAPLFDVHAPAIYIESTQFLLMILLTFVFRRRLPRNQFYGWCILILLFLFLPVVRILGLPFSLQRWANILQNGLCVGFGIFFLFGPDKWAVLVKKRKHSVGGRTRGTSGDAADDGKQSKLPRVVFYAALLFIFFNILAAICNLAGRVTLSQIFGNTSIYAFAQTVSLAVFVQIVVESFLLQIQTSRVRKNYPEQFDSAGISRSIFRFMIALAIFLWLIVFTTNLNLFDAINDLLTDFFTKSRQIGSFSFTLGGIILFLGIIWVANFLQRYITYFFGDTGDDAAIDDKGQRSKLLVTRLILLIAGFLLAVAASGLPIDKITVILGALGVGIGLGLQSIVNNFVSGIILIFDRPLRIGDTVEIGDKKGRVKEIGIRSSTLLTDEGAEVIIPNGDVLSHNIVNWTLSNNHVRISLSFNIAKPPHPEDIQMDAIKKIIQSDPNVLERREPEVILNSLSSKNIEIQVYFWSKDFSKTSLTAGNIRTAIYEHLDKQGITVL